MTRTKKITILALLIVALVIGYFLVIQRPERVEAPTGFRGPTGPPSVNGPSDPPPGQ